MTIAGKQKKQYHVKITIEGTNKSLILVKIIKKEK